MKITRTNINGAFVIEPEIFSDSRGFFFEAYNKKKLNKICNLDLNFVQENQSSSSRDVLRGLHYQIKKPQGKLVRVVAGDVLDVMVDLRKSSETFGKHFSVRLSSENKKQVWIPPGLAHGFLTKSKNAIFIYQTTDYYFPEYEKTILWNDSFLNINWGLDGTQPLVSTKDNKGKFFIEADYYD